MFEFVLGILIMMGSLAGVGFTRGRWLPQLAWVVAWLSISGFLGVLMAVEFVMRNGPSEFVYGMSLGYVFGVTIHTTHHFLVGIREMGVGTAR